MHQSAAASSLEVEGTKRILPDAAGVFDAIARIGYEFEHAVADLVDNSIDAGASEVLIRFFHDQTSVYSVGVIDIHTEWRMIGPDPAGPRVGRHRQLAELAGCPTGAV